MSFHNVQGVSLAGELKYSIKKKEAEPLRPIFEAFSNAWESIKEKGEPGEIKISLYLEKDLAEGFIFDHFVVRDNGVGVNEEGYERLKTLRDTSKGQRNFGTGRVQYVHSFDETKMKSISKWSSNEEVFKKLELTFSKKDEFLKQNAILREDENIDVDKMETFCELSFWGPLNEREKEYFEGLTAKKLKEELIKHFLVLLSKDRTFLPKIEISLFKVDEEIENEKIDINCIPAPEIEFDIQVPYSKKKENKIVSSSKKETFNVKSFELEKDKFLKENSAFFVSKGEIAQKIDFKNFISKDEDFLGKYYLFLVSGEYLETIDSDDRGNLKLVSRKEFAEREEDLLESEEVILKEEIEDNTKAGIRENCSAIKEAMQHSSDELGKIQKEFLLSDALIKRIRNKIKVNASTEDILRIAYKENVDDEAKEDFAIQQWRDDVKKLNPDDPDFQKKLEELEKNYTKKTSIEKRTELTRYVARRKIVLEAFDSILTKELNLFQEKGRINESILHNLIFRKKSSKVEESNLWLISEEFVYFKGTSDLQLDDILIDGKRFFKSDDEIKNINLSSEESDFRTELLKQKMNQTKNVQIFFCFHKKGNV